MKSKLRKGAPLLVKELKSLIDGSYIYVTYKKDDETRFRINGAYPIEYTGDNNWLLGDDGDFTLDVNLSDEDECYQDQRGECYLYHVY